MVGNRLGIVLGTAAGAGSWLAFMAGPRHAATSPRSEFLFPALALVAVLLALASRLPRHHVVAALVGPGLVLAPWTAPRGDEDGLWLLVFPLLLGAGALLAGIVAVLRRAPFAASSKRQ